MNHTIAAVFDAGVFRPLEPVDLAEGMQVVVQMPMPEAAEQVDEETRAAWIAYLDRMEAMPDDSPADGVSNRNHDQILYGE
jgi:predicted DNA-binding antitoxin AbrB/MazE fold protein